MPSLLNQPVAINYNKAYTSTNFGGRELTFLVLYAWEDFYAGDPALSAIGSDPSIKNTGGYNKLWSDSGSRYEIAVNAIGTVAELFFLGEPRPHTEPTIGPSPTEESFVFAIAKDTRDTTEGDYDLLVDALRSALGHNAFGIVPMSAIGDNFAPLP